MSILLSLRELGNATGKGSLLWQEICRHSSHQFVLQQYVEETLANLKFDGLAHDYDQVRSVMRRTCKPRDTAEIVALNFHEVMLDLADYDNQKVDRSL